MATKGTSQTGMCPEDNIKILIGTDCHLGYAEKTAEGIQKNDSFVTFEEILRYGRESKVDLAFFGGHLFHETEPSQTTMKKSIELLRKYCLGPGEDKLEFITKPKKIFKHCSFNSVEYKGRKVNISMPVISIHGNEDDLSDESVGAANQLSRSGLVNYFNKRADSDDIITISPLILKKGASKVAIYGLSHVNDKILQKYLTGGQVKLLKSEDSADCFNILVLHQNRFRRVTDSHVTDRKWPNFLNLIIWGCEPECRMKLEFNQEGHYCVLQPGSSIATSLSDGESAKKYAAILTINKMMYGVKKLRLKTVRPLVCENIILSNCGHLSEDSSEPLGSAVFNYVDKYIETNVWPKVKKRLTGHPEQPVEPLIKLNVLYSRNDQKFNVSRLANKYSNKVCNPSDMIIFRKERVFKTESLAKPVTSKSKQNAEENSKTRNTNMQDNGCKESVQSDPKKPLDSVEKKDCLLVFLRSEMSELLKGDQGLLKNLERYHLQNMINYLKSKNKRLTTKSITKAILTFRDTKDATKGTKQEDETPKIGAAVQANGTDRCKHKAQKRKFDNPVTTTGSSSIKRLSDRSRTNTDSSITASQVTIRKGYGGEEISLEMFLSGLSSRSNPTVDVQAGPSGIDHLL